MDASDWISLVDTEGRLSHLYEIDLPLEACDLFYLQIDERGTSVTLGFETSILPTNPHPDWSEKPYNTLEFYIEFTEIQDITIAGWTSSARTGIDFSTPGGRSVQVSINRPESKLHFTAGASSVTRLRPYLAAR
ncbi:Imm50 family immunity protein [Streptomyces sp. SBR177]